MKTLFRQGVAVEAPKKLVLATRNPGKVRELRGPLSRFGFDVQGLPEDFPETLETGTTFEENALLKAHAAARSLGLPVIADDSGLEVDALGGAPGVHSARYGDDWPGKEGETRDQRNNRRLLDALRGVPESRRTAHFHCCMVMVWPSASFEELVAHGVWEGRITECARGENGFGYDPLFLDPELGRTGAELSREEKMARSHRARALNRLLETLERRNAQQD